MTQATQPYYWQVHKVLFRTERDYTVPASSIWHDQEQEAVTEAMSLAKLNPDEEYIVKQCNRPNNVSTASFAEQKTEAEEEAENLQKYKQQQFDRTTKAMNYLTNCLGMSRNQAVSALFRINKE